MKNLKTKPHKELIINGLYSEFSDFYDHNKELIYKSIIDLFNDFKKTKKNTLQLHISSVIQGLEWDTEFNFTKEDSIVLKRDIMPYFEDIEDYEMCDNILKLYKELTKTK